MEKKKLELSDDVVLHLKHMRDALAGVPEMKSAVGGDELSRASCGELCEVTCSYYCMNNCEDTCMSVCDEECSGSCSFFMSSFCTNYYLVSIG